MAYNPQTDTKQKTKVFVADIQIESIFSFTKKYAVMVEKEDLYLPVVDRSSFKLSADFLLENFRYLAEQFKVSIPRTISSDTDGQPVEVDSNNYHVLDDIDASVFQRWRHADDGCGIVYGNTHPIFKQ